MNLTIPAPPPVTGNTEADLENLSEWCNMFYNQLKRVLCSMDNAILEITEEK